MKQFFALVKINIASFGSKLRGKTKKKGGFGILILISLLLLVLISIYAFLFAQVLDACNMLEMLIVIGLLGGFGLTLFESITSSNTYIFSSQDTELLLSLPISRKTIILSKIFSLYITNFFMTAAIEIPFFTAYAVVGHPNFVFYISFVFIVLFGNLFMMVIGSLIGLVIGLIGTNLKHKSIIQSALTVIFLVLYMFFYMKFVNTSSVDIADAEAMEALVASMTNLKTNIFRYVFPLEHSFVAMSGNFLRLLIVLAVNALPFGLFVFLLDKFYINLHGRLLKSYTNKNYKYKSQKSQKPIRAIMKKDLRTILSNTNVAMNVIISPLMSCILIIVMTFSMDETVVGDSLFYILLGLSMFMSSLVSMTASLISLEGPQFQIIKLSPISSREIINAKVLFAMVVSCPFIAIETVFIGIWIADDPFQVLTYLVTMLGLSYFEAMLGLYINIKKPMMDWDNPIKVVKQSKSVLLSMLLDVVFGILALILIVVPSLFLPSWLSLIISIFVVGIYVIVMREILYSTGVRKLDCLEC